MSGVEYDNVLYVVCLCVARVPYGVPCLPFYSHKGWQGCYMCKSGSLSLMCSRVIVLTLWRSTASSLWCGQRHARPVGSVAEPCSGRGGRIRGPMACPAAVEQ